MIIIHGPAACGKTRNAEALRAKYRCHDIFDDFPHHSLCTYRRRKIILDSMPAWSPRDRWRVPQQGDLVLTNWHPDELRAVYPQAEFIAFHDAIKGVPDGELAR